jgi:hypothetical protein
LEGNFPFFRTFFGFIHACGVLDVIELVIGVIGFSSERVFRVVGVDM